VSYIQETSLLLSSVWFLSVGFHNDLDCSPIPGGICICVESLLYRRRCFHLLAKDTYLRLALFWWNNTNNRKASSISSTTKPKTSSWVTVELALATIRTIKLMKWIFWSRLPCWLPISEKVSDDFCNYCIFNEHQRCTELFNLCLIRIISGMPYFVVNSLFIFCNDNYS